VAGLLSKPEIFQDHIMLLVASPLDAYSVVVSGVKVNKINIGGMHYAPGRRQLVKAVSVSDSDVEILKKLKEKGVKFNCSPQISPDGKAKVAFCEDPDGVPIELVEELN